MPVHTNQRNQNIAAKNEPIIVNEKPARIAYMTIPHFIANIFIHIEKKASSAEHVSQIRTRI